MALPRSCTEDVRWDSGRYLWPTGGYQLSVAPVVPNGRLNPIVALPRSCTEDVRWDSGRYLWPTGGYQLSVAPVVPNGRLNPIVALPRSRTEDVRWDSGRYLWPTGGYQLSVAPVVPNGRLNPINDPSRSRIEDVRWDSGRYLWRTGGYQLSVAPVVPNGRLNPIMALPRSRSEDVRWDSGRYLRPTGGYQLSVAPVVPNGRLDPIMALSRSRSEDVRWDSGRYLWPTGGYQLSVAPVVPNGRLNPIMALPRSRSEDVRWDSGRYLWRTALNANHREWGDGDATPRAFTDAARHSLSLPCPTFRHCLCSFMRTAFCLHPSYDTPAWKRWLDMLPDTAGHLPPTQLIQRGRNDVYWLEHGDRKLVLKRFLNRGPWKKAVYRIASSKARRSYQHSLRLMEIGLRSPQPVAWREDWRGSWLHESYYLCEYIDYVHDAKALLDPATPDWEQKTVLAGQTVAKLHEAGIDHLDLNSGNLLFVGDQRKGWQILIIDNNRMRFGPVSTTRGVKSLLLMGLDDPAISTLIDSYAKTRGLNPENCRERYERSVKRHQLKWRIKDGTRPWRRKLGL